MADFLSGRKGNQVSGSWNHLSKIMLMPPEPPPRDSFKWHCGRLGSGLVTTSLMLHSGFDLAGLLPDGEGKRRVGVIPLTISFVHFLRRKVTRTNQSATGILNNSFLKLYYGFFLNLFFLQLITSMALFVFSEKNSQHIQSIKITK